MESYKKNAIAAGVLFVIADLVGFVSLPFIQPMNDTNYLVSVSANANRVTTAALLLFIGAMLNVPRFLFPGIVVGYLYKRLHESGMAKK